MMAVLAIYQFFAPAPTLRGGRPVGTDSAQVAAGKPASGVQGAVIASGSDSASIAPGATGTDGPGVLGLGMDAGAGLAAVIDSVGWGDTAAQPADVTVENSFFAATFSTRGAVIKSWRLKKFGGPSGEPWVELVPPESNGGLNLLLDTPRGKIDFARVHFTPSTTSLRLDGSNRSGTLSFEAHGPGGALVREVLTFSEDSYSFGLDLVVLDASGRPYPGTERASYQWTPGIDLTEADMESEVAMLGVIASLPENIFRANIHKFQKTPTLEPRQSVNWAAIRNKYFLVSVVPAVPGKLNAGFSGDVERAHLEMVAELPSLAEISGPAGAPQGGGLHPGDLEVYLGPMDHKTLERYGRGLEQAVDLGWRWIQPLSRATHWLLVQTHRAIPNWGLAIILLATLSKLIFHPLTDKSVKSTRAMQRLQPQVAELREKYKNDPQRQQREMMKLYKDAGVNPLGGCLPLLVQSPVFMALFNVLQHAIELRQAPFMLWIDDLSAPDALFGLPFVLPFLGAKFNLLPIIMGVSMYWQTKTAMPHGVPVDPRSQAQMMNFIMPPMMTIFFYKFPSGLVIYWIVNTLLTIAHQYYLNRDEKTKAAAPAETPKKRRRGRGGSTDGDGGGNGNARTAMTAGLNSSGK